MDTGYASGDASNIGFPSSIVQLPPNTFGGASAAFTFGGSSAGAGAGAIGTSLPPFGASSQPTFGAGAPFGGQSGQSQPFAFGAPQQQAQPAFGFGPGIAGGPFGQQQQQQEHPAFTFGAPQAQPQQQGMSGGYGASPGMGVGMGMGSMGGASAGGGGGGGFSMGAAAAPGVRRKIKARRPGQQ